MRLSSLIQGAVKSVATLILVALYSGLFAQFDTRFWMPPIWDTGVSNHQQPSELFITTPSPTPIDVHIETADGSWSFDGTVVSGTPLQVPLTPSLGQTTLPNQVLTSSGLIVTSSEAIQCVHKISGVHNQTLVTLKGQNARGTDFWTGSQVRNMNANYSPNEYHFISVMALEDNTEITFETPFEMFTEGAGNLPNPYTITLNANESYLIRGNNPTEHVAGGHVTSDKEIVVISGSTHTRILGGSAADGGTDQLVPIDLMGEEFVVVKGDNVGSFDYAIIVATENSTEVFLDGGASPVATLNAGEYYDYTLTGSMGAPHYLRADKPVYCFHFTGASQDDEVGMSAIPQVECTGSRYIEFSKFQQNTVNQIMNLTVPPEAEPSLTVNGVPYTDVPSLISFPVPGLTGWVSVTIPDAALEANNIITSEGFFHAGFLTGNGGATGTYGYLSGFDDAFEFLSPFTGLPTTIYTVGKVCQGESIDHCLLIFSCGDDHNIIDFEGNNGGVVVTPPTQPFDTCFNYTAPFDYVGGDTITFTVENRFGFSGDIDIVFTVLDPETPIDAGPVQELCGITQGVLSAVNPDPLAIGSWSLVSGSGTISDPSSPTTGVTGLGLGTNTFAWTQDYGCTQNTAFTQIIVYDGEVPDANAGPDDSLCSDDNSYQLQGNDPGVTATGTWDIVQGSATINNVNNPNALATNIGIGENIFVWTLDNGPCDGAVKTDQVSIFVFDTNHPDADAGEDLSICATANQLAVGGVVTTLNASEPIFPASGTWSLIEGSGTIVDPNDPTSEVFALGSGVNTFVWTIDNGPCGEFTDTVSISVFEQAAGPMDAGEDVSLCTPTTNYNLQANAVSGAGFGTWSVQEGAGTFSDLNDPNASVTNLSIGTNVLRWTLDNGPCANSGEFDEITITVFDQSEPSADAGEDQQLCVAAITDVQLAASPVTAPASGSWSLLSGTGNIADPSNPNSLVSGLSLGANSFLWTVDNGPCEAPTTDTVTITIYNDDLAPANAGEDVSFCTPTSTHTMQATNPTAPAVGEWTLVQGTGTISNVNNPNANISGLGIGENRFRWTILNGPCPGEEVFDEVSIFIFDENAPAANAGEDQSICDNPLQGNEITLSANAVIFPGTGTWTVVSGSGNIADPNNPLTNVSDLAVGENIFEWTINNGPCVPSVSSDQVSIFVYSNSQEAADAGEDQAVCNTDPQSTLAGNSVTFPATGTWTLISGAGTITEPNDPNTLVTGLGTGVNVFEWSIENGPCGAETSDQMIITVYEGAISPANAGQDQVICSTTASLSLAGNPPVAPASGSWSVVSGSATFANPSQFNTTVTNLGVGQNTLVWTVDNGPCAGSTSDEVVITVFDQSAPAANAGPDQFICLPQTSVQLAANSAVFPAVGTWTLINGSGNFDDINDPSTTVTGLSLGLNTFRWTLSNGPCAPASTQDQVTVFVYDNTQSISAGADQSFCSPVSSTNLNGSPAIFPATGTWTLVSGQGTIANPSNPSSSVSNLGLGDNVFQWSIDNGACTPNPLTDTVTITIFDGNQASADAGENQEICSPTSTAVLNGNVAVYPASGLWTLVSGSATIDEPSNPLSSISNLSVGTHVFEWTINNGPCGSSSDLVSIEVFDSAAPTASTGNDLSLCLPSNSANLSANAAIAPGTGVWSLVSGNGNILNPNDPNSGVNGLTLGENVFEWTIDNGSCGGQTSATMSIFVFSPNAPAANAGVDQNLCTPDNFTNLEGNTPLFPGTGMWTLVSGSGIIAEPSNPGSAVSGLAIGENIFEWTINNGPCGTTSDQISIFVFDGGAPQADAGPNQTLCTPLNSTSMNALAAVAPGQGTWSLVSGTGTIADANDPNTLISGLSVGVNVFEWSLDYSTCGTQADQVVITVYDASIPPANAGADQELCTPSDATSLNASPVNSPALGTWTLIQGSGDIAQVNNATSSVSNLAVGENIFVWTVNNGECLAEEDRSDTVSIFVYNSNLPLANAGDDQELCTPQTSTNLSGSAAPFPAQGTWTLISGSATIADSNDPNTLVSNLAVGENIFQWTVDNGACDPSSSSDTVSIFVFDENQPAADAGADQEWCTPLPSIALEGNTVTFPATGTWTLISGTGNIADPNNPNSLVTNLAPGENVFRWRIENGPCGTATQDFVSIFVYDQGNAAAAAGPDQELCFPTTSTNLQGNTPTHPATGTWTLIAGAATIADVNNPNSSVSNLSVGINTFVWTVNNGPCENAITSDTVSVWIFDPAAPQADAGADINLCTPGNATNMNANTPLIPGVGTWSVVSGAATIADINNPNTSVSDLPVGETVLEWTIYNGPCAGSGSSDLVSIFVFDREQEAAFAGADQQLCSPQEATLLEANAATFPASGSWELIEGSGNIVNINDPNSAFTNIGFGENVLVWTIDNGVCDNAITTDTVVISLFAFDAEVANAGPDQELCLPNTSATLAANPVTGAASGSWQLLSGSASIADVNDPNTLVSDLGVGVNTFAWIIDNGPCGMSSDEVSILVFDPNAPVADAGEDQHFCTPISTTVLNGNLPATPGTGTWTLASGMGTIANPNDPNTALSGLTIGENVFCWTIYNGPCGEVTTDCVSIFIYDENHPMAQAGEDQELCLPQSSSVLSATPAIYPAFGTWELVEGSGTIAEANNPNSLVSGLALGANTFVWTVNNSPCEAGNSSDTVTIFVYEEDIAPAFAGDDQSFCSPTSSSILTANELAAPNSGTWELLEGSGVIEDPFNPTSNVSALTVGENTFVWTVYNGPCELALSSDTVSIFIYDHLQEPADAGPDQELCEPVTSTLLQANAPTFPAFGEWTLVSGSADILDAASPNSGVSNLGVGINTFVWTIYNGPCDPAMSSDTVQVLVFSEAAAAADAGSDIDLCAPASSVSLGAMAPDTPGTGSWSIVQGSGSFDDPNDPNATISGLSIGEHILQWTVYNGPCLNNNTFDFVTVTVYDNNLEAVNAGEDIAICAPDDSVVLNALAPPFPAEGTWSLVSGSGSIADVHDPQTTISGLSIGTTVLSWSVSNGPCDEPAQALVTITVYNPESPDAEAGEDQHFCTPFGGAVLEGNAPFEPALGSWTLISGAGEITNPSVPNTTVFNLGLGENIFVWTIDNGPCANGLTTDTVSVFVNDLSVAAANAGPDESLCGQPFEHQLQGSVTIGNTATGVWTVLEGQGDFENLNNEATYVSNLAPGINTFLWTVDNGECGISSDEVTITVFDPEVPEAFAGTDLEICEDDFIIFNLPGSEAPFPANGYWTVLDGPIDIGDMSDPNSTVWSLGSIQSPLVPVTSTVVWTVENGPCGTSADTVSYTLEDCLTIDIPDAFSPNGDGINDVYEIPNLFKYPNNAIKIFNRWGALIYEAAPYKNDWDGRSRHNATIGEELPVGTYYYILDLGAPGLDPLNGFILLKR